MERGQLEGVMGALAALWGPARFEEAGGEAWLRLREMEAPPADLPAWAAWVWQAYKGAEVGEYRERGRRRRPRTGLDWNRIGGPGAARGEKEGTDGH